jgi:hypothetical protein
VIGCCEHDNKPLNYIKFENYLGQVCKYHTSREILCSGVYVKELAVYLFICEKEFGYLCDMLSFYACSHMLTHARTDMHHSFSLF